MEREEWSDRERGMEGRRERNGGTEREERRDGEREQRDGGQGSAVVWVT